MNPIARRHFFRDCGYGLGKAALASLLVNDAHGADTFAPKQPHFPAKAKAVIHLFMAGAPSQLELFDYKPALAKLEGKPLPPEVIKGQRYAFIRPEAGVLGCASSSRSTAKAEPNSARCSRIWPRWWTTSRS